MDKYAQAWIAEQRETARNDGGRTEIPRPKPGTLAGKRSLGIRGLAWKVPKGPAGAGDFRRRRKGGQPPQPPGR